MSGNPINDLAAVIPIAVDDCHECGAVPGRPHELSCDEVPVEAALRFLGVAVTSDLHIPM